MDVFAAGCPSRETFEHVTGRWGILVLIRLSDGPVRFRELYRSIGGISERMLSKTLKLLEAENFVIRRECDAACSRVEYSLSESGKRLAQSLDGFISQLYREMEQRGHNMSHIGSLVAE